MALTTSPLATWRPRAFGELRLVRVCPLADVGEGVDLAEALEELEFDLDDVGQAAARLQARTDRLIFRVALAGIHEFDLDARMRGVEHVDLHAGNPAPTTTEAP